jgi:hypothetical protein
MTLAEAGEIFAHWTDSPPAHLMLQTIAAMLGWKPRAASGRTGDLAALVSAPPAGLAVVGAGAAAMPAAVFDIAALRGANRARASEMARRERNNREGME